MPRNKVYYPPDLSKLPDCIGLSATGKCNRLSMTACLGNECSFKQTSEEEKESIRHSYQHLLNLDNSTQIKIANKYYSGKMPWNHKK